MRARGLFAAMIVVLVGACASAGPGDGGGGGAGAGEPDPAGPGEQCDPGGCDAAPPVECEPMDCAALGAECGAPDDGCGAALDCGACGAQGTCDGYTCVCTADGAEPNDASASARHLGSLPDVPPSSASAHGMFGTLVMESDVDADWYSVAVTDECCDGNPLIDVTYTAGYDVGAWFVCSAGGLYATCSGAGVTADQTFGAGCVISPGGGDGSFRVSTECDGTNEDGTLYVRVRAPSAAMLCMPYALAFDVD